MRNTFTAHVVIGTLMLAGCTFNSGGSNAAYQEQVEAFDRQTAQTGQMLEEQAAQTERSSKLLALQEEAFDRYEKLLIKWEDQARRMDAVIEAQEKKAGFAPTPESNSPTRKLEERDE